MLSSHTVLGLLHLTTPFSLFEFLHLHFSLQNSAVAFQRIISNVKRDLYFLHAYIDDLITEAEVEKFTQLRLLAVEGPSTNRVVVNSYRCDFNETELTLIDHEIFQEVIIHS